MGEIFVLNILIAFEIFLRRNETRFVSLQILTFVMESQILIRVVPRVCLGSVKFFFCNEQIKILN